MDTNMFDKVKDTTIDGLRFFVSHRVCPSVQRLFKRLTFSHTERPHHGYSQNFNFSYVPAYHNHHVSPSNSPSQQDGTTSTADLVRIEKQRFKAAIYAWMEGIPPEDELMDPNFDGTDGVSDREREWVRAVSPSIGSGVDRPGSSTGVGERVVDSYNREGQDVAVKGGAWDDDGLRLVEDLALAMRSISQVGSEQHRVEAEGDKKQGRARQSATTTTQNTPPPTEFVHATINIPKTNSSREPVQGSITPGVVFQIPPPRPPLSSSQPCSFLKKDKSKRLSLWKRVTKRYSGSTLI